MEETFQELGGNGGIAIGDIPSRAKSGAWGLRRGWGWGGPTSFLLETDKNIGIVYIEMRPCGPKADGQSESSEVKEEGSGYCPGAGILPIPMWAWSPTEGWS